MAAMVKTLYNFSGIRVKTVFPYGPHRILNKELFSGVGFFFGSLFCNGVQAEFCSSLFEKAEGSGIYYLTFLGSECSEIVLLAHCKMT